MQTVAVAMSGGVDSSTTALILKEKGYRVFGLTMPTGSSAVQEARRVADFLGIEHIVADLGDIFQSRVVEYFCRAYLAGQTPNPCISCNRYVKYGALFDYALAQGADFFATGHYARVYRDQEQDRQLLLRAVNRKKDQSYVLYHLSQERLRHLLLPLGEVPTKDDVRRMAEAAGLPYLKKESQEICFVPGDDYRAFLTSRYGQEIRPGSFVDTEGKVLGQHQGLPFYTIGQRKGLGIALGSPAYVVSLDPSSNSVVLGQESDLMSAGLSAAETHFMMQEFARTDAALEVQIRYNARAVPARLVGVEGDKARVVFDRPQRAVTPGQAAVFYHGDFVVGGGIITAGMPVNRGSALRSPCPVRV